MEKNKLAGRGKPHFGAIKLNPYESIWDFFLAIRVNVVQIERG